MIKADITESYQSPQGDGTTWELNIRAYGSSKHYDGFTTADQAFAKLLSEYPDEELDVKIYSLAWWNKYGIGDDNA